MEKVNVTRRLSVRHIVVVMIIVMVVVIMIPMVVVMKPDASRTGGRDSRDSESQQ